MFVLVIFPKPSIRAGIFSQNHNACTDTFLKSGVHTGTLSKSSIYIGVVLLRDSNSDSKLQSFILSSFPSRFEFRHESALLLVV